MTCEVLSMYGYPGSKRRISKFILGCVTSLLWLAASVPSSQSGQAQEPATRIFVGSAACQPCHPGQYNNFNSYARKSHSFRSIQRMQKGLSGDEVKECYFCHTTGYGKPGGFISIEQTPELKDAGCEVCHGPGKSHVETQDPGRIDRNVTLETCQRCHTQERLRAFRYRPLLHGGAH
jgi:hypothetical protein